MLTAFNSYRPGWEAAGGYIVDGIVVGIENNQSKAIQAAVAMALAALAAAQAALGINSPSTEGISMGEYFDLGFALGLVKYAGLAEKSAAKVGDTAINSLSNALSNISTVVGSNLDMAPTIRPVIDLTDVKMGAKSINSLLSKTQGINIDGTRKKAVSAQADIEDTDNGSKVNSKGKGGDTYVDYKQYNYSPKALSRIDIYRQTKNQLSTLKGLVNAK
jgi:type IV secretory pathway TrbL component